MNISKFFTCKPIAQLLEEAKDSFGLDRTLGAFQLMMLGIGSIVGAGIFAIIGIAVGEHAGPAAVISFALAGFACMCAAFCYAELSSALPISGGSYSFTYATLGELPAFIIAGLVLMGYCLAAGTVANGWSSYLQSFLSDYGIHLPAVISKNTGSIVTMLDGSKVVAWFDLPAFFITTAIFLLIYFGTELSAIINTIVVIVKMSVLFGFILIGATHIDLINWQPFIPTNTGEFGAFGCSGVFAATTILLLSYVGFDVVASAAQETKEPHKNLPIGIISSLVVCILFYVIVCAVMTGVVKYTQLNVSDPLAVVANAINMSWFRIFLKLGAVIGMTTVILGLMYACVRIVLTIAHDGLLPKSLTKIHKKHHTPYVASILIWFVMAYLSAASPIELLVKAASFGFIMNFSIACVAALVLRKTQPNLKREFKCPFVPVLPLIGIVLFSAMVFTFTKEIFVFVGSWVGILLLLYMFYSRRYSPVLNG